MQKKWIILTLVLILIVILLAPLIFTVWFNTSHASIYYGVSITGLENHTVSEPITILVPLPLMQDTVALPGEKLPPVTNGWNVSLVETEHGQMIALTSTEPVLRDPGLSVWQYDLPASQVPITNAAQLHLSTENSSSYSPQTALISLFGLRLPTNETVTIDISFQTSSKYEDLLMQPNNMRGIYRLSATASISSGKESGWITLPVQRDPY